MQIKASARNHYTFTRIPEKKRTANAKSGHKCETIEILMCSSWEHTWSDHFGKLGKIYQSLNFIHYDP